MVFADNTIPVDYAADSIYTTAGLYGSNPYHEQHYRSQAERISKLRIAKNARVLDVGCATGGLLRALAAQGFTQLKGISLSAGEVAACREQGFNAEVRSVSELADQYDLVVVSHVLEHVYEVHEFLRDLRRSIAPGGVLYVEVPDVLGYTDHLQSLAQGFNQEHINHFSLAHLREVISLHRFAMHDDGDCETTPVINEFAYPICWVAATPVLPIDCGVENALTTYIAKLKYMTLEAHTHLKRALAGVSHLAVWGLGQTTLQIASSGVLDGIEIKYCTDSNPCYHGFALRGDWPIASPPKQFSPEVDIPILVCSKVSKQEIIDTIRRNGLKNRIIEAQM